MTVRVTTANGSATVGLDYQAVQTTLAFAPGETTRTVDVKVIGDTHDEANETVLVRLAVPTNAAVRDDEAVLTIVDDDGSADGCTPRPAIQTRTRQTAPDTIEVTVTYQSGPSAAQGGLQLVRLQADANARIGVPAGMTSTYVQGSADLSGSVAMKPASPDRDFVFTVRRVAPGPFMVNVTVNDSCGEWKTFVGGGAGIP